VLQTSGSLCAWRVLRWLVLPMTALTLIACATPSASARPSADVRVVDECRDFAEQTVPHEPVHGDGRGRSTVYPSRDADSLRTLFDLCMQAKEALK
jgi:hypothetical protein